MEIENKTNDQSKIIIYLQDKTNVYETIEIVNKNDNFFMMDNNKISFNLNTIELPNAGVYTIQLYSEKTKKEEKIEKEVEFLGKIEQEIDIFIKPKSILGTKINLKKKNLNQKKKLK